MSETDCNSWIWWVNLLKVERLFMQDKTLQRKDCSVRLKFPGEKFWKGRTYILMICRKYKYLGLVFLMICLFISL